MTDFIKAENLIAAMNYLYSDYLINSSIIEPIKAGTVEVLYASHDCVMVKDNYTSVVMLQTENLELADKLLDNLPHGTTHIVAHNDELQKLVEKKLDYNVSVPCYQAVYRKEPFELTDTGDLKIRLLREDEADIACRLYHFTHEDAIEHIKLGLVYGGFCGDEAAAIIGMHMQGSMGILSVDEKFRRRGYGEIMEKFLINSLLEKGLVPYCQIIEDNVASLSLQSKLGLDISKNMLYWMRDEEKLKIACENAFR